jgi:hypothetical protein
LRTSSIPVQLAKPGGSFTVYRTGDGAVDPDDERRHRDRPRRDPRTTHGEGLTVGYAFYWANNDGLGGHVWLGERDLRALTDEMLVQGMPWPAERVESDDLIAADELEAVLGPADPEPKVLPDAKLWLDWLRFLEGAARNGGLLVRR